MKVSDSLSYDWLSSGHSSRFAGSNPRNDTSSGLDRTDLDTKDEGQSLLQPTRQEDHYHLKVPSRLVPPWEGWKPDSNFLHELHKWNIANKDRKLPAVLAKVNSILESKPVQAALEFIPSSPFPAKPLVKTIVSLIQLGIVSDISSQTPCHLPILISRPPRKFLRRGMTSMILRIRWLLISPTWPQYLVTLEVVS